MGALVEGPHTQRNDTIRPSYGICLSSVTCQKQAAASSPGYPPLTSPTPPLQQLGHPPLTNPTPQCLPSPSSTRKYFSPPSSKGEDRNLRKYWKYIFLKVHVVGPKIREDIFSHFIAWLKKLLSSL